MCLSAGVLSAALPVASFGQADEPADPQPRFRAVRVLASQLGEGGVVPLAVPAQPASQYWLGVGLGIELSEIVKEQLGLKHGLVVADVFPDSPALKAGFQKNDILVKVGDKPLAEPADLVKAVEEAKETEMSIGLFRGGKEVTVKVTPAKRPVEEVEARAIELPKSFAPGQLQEEIKRLEEALKMLREKGAGGGADIVIARPGVVLPRSIDVVVKHGEFPKDLSISVSKDGDQPAKIHVKKGDKEWNVTQDKLGELPDDVRPHVHHFFGGLWGPGLKELSERLKVGGPKIAHIQGPPGVPGVAPVPTVPAPPATPAAPGTEAPRAARAFQYRIETRGTDDKLEEIMKELKALRKEVDELRGKSGEDKK
jgi:hypothetical protein